MPKHPPERSNHAGNVPCAPEPSASSAPAGVENTRAMARRYLPDVLGLFVNIALGKDDNESALHTRMLCAKEIVNLAGVLPPTTPQLPPPSHEAVSDGSDRN
jgi:hypothetical protein